MRRREFLTGVISVPTAAALDVGQARSSTRSQRQLKLGIVTYLIGKDWDVPTIIKSLTEAQYDAVELRTTHRHGVEIALTPAERLAVRKQFDASPVRIGGLGTTCEFHSPDPVALRKNIDETKQWVLLAHDLGSPSVKVRPNGIPKNVP